MTRALMLATLMAVIPLGGATCASTLWSSDPTLPDPEWGCGANVEACGGEDLPYQCYCRIKCPRQRDGECFPVPSLDDCNFENCYLHLTNNGNFTTRNKDELMCKADRYSGCHESGMEWNSLATADSIEYAVACPREGPHPLSLPRDR